VNRFKACRWFVEFRDFVIVIEWINV